MGDTGDTKVWVVRGGDPEKLHQGTRVFRWLYLARQCRPDPLVRLLSHRWQLMALNEHERALLLWTFVLVAHVRVVLWLLPSRLSLKIVRRLEEVDARPRSGYRPAVERVAWAVEAVSRRVPRATCLTQAIAAQLLLRHYGYQSRLCLGVARSEEGKLFAHAWLERDGRIVIGGAQSVGLSRLPALSTTFQRNSAVETR